MTTNGRPAYDLLREWIANDHPVYRFGREGVQLNRENSLDYGAGLRDLVLDIRSSGMTVPTFPGGRSVNRAYRTLCVQMGDLPEYKHGYPVEDGPAVWTMEQITDREFGAVDWTRLADDVFPPVADEK